MTGGSGMIFNLLMACCFFGAWFATDNPKHIKNIFFLALAAGFLLPVVYFSHQIMDGSASMTAQSTTIISAVFWVAAVVGTGKRHRLEKGQEQKM